MIAQSVLRTVHQTVGCREYLIEVLTLMVVEAHVHERGATDTCRVHKAQLIEAHVRLVQAIELLSVLLRHETEARAHRRMTEQSDTGGVSTHGRDVCAQRVHRTTHSHVACRTVQVTAQQAGALICILCSGRDCHRQHKRCHKNLLHISIN